MADEKIITFRLSPTLQRDPRIAELIAEANRRLVTEHRHINLRPIFEGPAPRDETGASGESILEPDRKRYRNQFL